MSGRSGSPIVFWRRNRFSRFPFIRLPATRRFSRSTGGNQDAIPTRKKITGFTPVATPGGGVSYLQADLVLVCRRVLRFGLTKDAVPPEIAKGVSSRSYHVQYTGEVIGVWKRNP